MAVQIEETEAEEKSLPTKSIFVDNTEKLTPNNHTANSAELALYDHISSLPRFDYNAIRKEMAEMKTPVYDNPSTNDLLDGLRIVQGYRERLSQILVYMTKTYTILKRDVEMLHEITQTVSKQSSVDKRKGEADMRYTEVIWFLSTLEGEKKGVEEWANNLKAASDMLSRQVSLTQMQIQLGEYQKKMSYEFNNSEIERADIDYKTGVPKLDFLKKPSQNGVETEWSDI